MITESQENYEFYNIHAAIILRKQHWTTAVQFPHQRVVIMIKAFMK